MALIKTACKEQTFPQPAFRLFIIGIAWQNLTGAENFIDDEDGFNLNVGLSLRF